MIYVVIKFELLNQKTVVMMKNNNILIQLQYQIDINMLRKLATIVASEFADGSEFNSQINTLIFEMNVVVSIRYFIKRCNYYNT